MLTLAPQHCDRCMSCLPACPQRAIEVGSSFIFIDWSRCDGCGACVGACEAGAIRPRAARDAGTADAPSPAGPDARVAVTRGAAAERAAVPQRAVVSAPPRLRVVTEADLDERAKRPALDHIAPLAPSWEAWEVVVVLGVVFALFATEQAFLSSHWMTTVVPIGAKPLMRSGIMTLYYAAQLAMLAALGYRKRVGFAEAFGLRWFPIAATVGVVGLVVATRLFTLAYAVAAETLGWKMAQGPMADLTQYFGRDGVGLALTVLMIVIVGPFFEEIVFRGVLMGYLQERVGARWAILASAAVFAAFHVNVWMFVPVFVMALAAGYLAVRSRSLWAAYALHLLYNAVPVALVILLPK